MAPKLDQGAEHVVADKESPTRRTAHHSEAKLCETRFTGEFCSIPHFFFGGDQTIEIYGNFFRDFPYEKLHCLGWYLK